MINLIKRDLRMHLLPTNMISYVFIGIVGFCIFSGNNPPIRNLLVIGYVGIAAALSVFPYDERYNFYMIINSLPIKKSRVVLSRYISSFIILCILMLFASLLTAISNFGTEYMWDGFSTDYILRVLTPYLFFVSIAYPLHYRLSFKVAKVINAFCYVGYFSIIIGLFGAGSKFNISYINTVILRNGFYMGVALMFLSIILSTIVYRRKFS